MGRAPCCDKASVKKGPWSPEEDAKLKEFIEKYGTGGNWIALPQKVGLKRCGKSCRLRWLNYLRPNIKHGEFSDEEDRIICTLYASIGSRWSIIAAQLPGRTDNDIKNYWNTKLKKKLMGLNMVHSNQTKVLSPYANTVFQSQSSQPLSSLSQIYTSLYTQATKSLSAGIDSITTQKNFLYPTNNDFPLATTNQYSYLQQSQEGLLHLQCYDNLAKDSSSMLVFGGNDQKTSCSSSDGTSCKHISYGKFTNTMLHHVKKQEGILGNEFQGFLSNVASIEDNSNNQKFFLQYWKMNGYDIYQKEDPLNGFLDVKPNGFLENNQLQCDLEEVKQLITSGNNADNSCNDNSGSFSRSNNGNSFLNDESKSHCMYYY